eukprot:gene11258-12556_t
MNTMNEITAALPNLDDERSIASSSTATTDSEQVEYSIDRIMKMMDEGDRPTSKSAIARLQKQAQYYKCMSCPFHAENAKSLRKHIFKKKHYYGLPRLKEEKEDFASRVQEEHQVEEEGLGSFRHMHAFYREMASHEKREYIVLLYISYLQISMRRTRRSV